MDHEEACKESHAREKLDIGKRREEDKSSYDPVLEEGEFRKDEPFGLESLVHKDMVASAIKLSSLAKMAVKKGQVNTRQSTSPERGSHQVGTANTTVEQSKYSPLEGQSVNVRQTTFHRKCSEKHRQCYSPSFHVSSKERHEQRKRTCFGYHEYHHALEKIEKVCSERLGKLLLQQNGDRKEFNILRKKQESEFFQEHVHSYKVHYERVIPTVRYHRMKLPKLLFCILCEIFHKHIQSQLRNFVKWQINDRNKEKRKKERWIFEAKAGYLKKYFDETSLTYSGFEMEKSKWRVHDYSGGEEQLKYLGMQSLITEIEAIASSSELEGTHTSKESGVFEPVLENLQSPLETNGGTKHGLSVDAAEEIAIVNSMSSQLNYTPAMEFSEKVGTQVEISSPPQNEGENVEKSCSSEEVTGEALDFAKAVTADSENTPPVSREKRSRTSSGDDAPEGSCSRSQRKFPHEFASNFHKTALDHEEPRAARPPSVNVDQTEQADDAGRKEVPSDQTSSCAQITEQRNINVNSSMLTQSLTQQQQCDPTSQNAAHQYQPSSRNTCSVRTGLDSPGASNVQQQSANQMTTNSMVEQYLPESGLQSEPITTELSQLLRLCSDNTSTFAQVTEQRNGNAHLSPLTQRVTQQQYQPSGGNTCSVRAWLDGPGASTVQRQSANQTTGSTLEQNKLESGLQSDPLTIELSQLLVLRDLMSKRHLFKRQKIILEREMAMAECKRKFDEQFHNLEMETLQEKKDIQILQDKLCKQQMLAETFQVIHKASAGVVSCCQRGTPRITTGEPNQSSDQ
ncbi:uncharacterized protein LOC133919353 [Phragmites australis]|uniref:uncharacterized protein LOC133919353 n=1 Tax=Phragmites australis TaxID=29695 RepID=UPI002D774CD2|nr:uncharacterized protein LOC133919353 [Phragmites australis]XP_062219711.1 uncharacterized protein LOC133919353 [Phragmites australis]XP_062219712.1 uncharacterized protein LOC133919353 [Phragmites australis]